MFNPESVIARLNRNETDSTDALFQKKMYAMVLQVNRKTEGASILRSDLWSMPGDSVLKQKFFPGFCPYRYITAVCRYGFTDFDGGEIAEKNIRKLRWMPVLLLKDLE